MKIDIFFYKDSSESDDYYFYYHKTFCFYDKKAKDKIVIHCTSDGFNDILKVITITVNLQDILCEFECLKDRKFYKKQLVFVKYYSYRDILKFYDEKRSPYDCSSIYSPSKEKIKLAFPKFEDDHIHKFFGNKFHNKIYFNDKFYCDVENEVEKSWESFNEDIKVSLLLRHGFTGDCFSEHIENRLIANNCCLVLDSRIKEVSLENKFGTEMIEYDVENKCVSDNDLFGYEGPDLDNPLHKKELEKFKVLPNYIYFYSEHVSEVIPNLLSRNYVDVEIKTK